MQKLIASLLLVVLSSCKDEIDINSIERRDHGLSYIKGTNTLVDGKAVLKSKDGKLLEVHSYSNGKMIGDFFIYGDNGQVMSHGFGTEIKDYEKSLGGVDLSYCILSIVNGKDELSYATLYMDNPNLFADREKIIHLAKAVISDYADKHKFDGLLIFDNNHQYTVSKSVLKNTNYSIDTVPDKKILKVNIH